MGYGIIFRMNMSEIRDKLFAKIEKLEDPKSIFKDEIFADLNAKIREINPSERAEFGKNLNELRGEISRKIVEIENAKKAANVEKIDITAPFGISSREKIAEKPELLSAENGTIHPLNEELNRVIDIFARMGFSAHESRGLDDDFHMFTALNFPENHPARDAYDTFRTEEGFIPPAHTSTMQNRVLKAGRDKLVNENVPIASISYGRVFRNEDADVTHDHTFHQVEGVFVSRDATVGQMLGTLREFFETYYGQKLKIKTQPGYFPFTEPSMEFQIEKPAALGGGGKGGEWLEMLGCGMIHPNVLKMAGIDPTEFCGFAWGGGLERLVMLKYGIEDLRHFESGKLAFLREFK